jgi:hypothetical protein
MNHSTAAKYGCSGEMKYFYISDFEFQMYASRDPSDFFHAQNLHSSCAPDSTCQDVDAPLERRLMGPGWLAAPEIWITTDLG